jgi:protein O-GlcNAc transferase
MGGDFLMSDEEKYFGCLTKAFDHIQGENLEAAIEECDVARSIKPDGPEILCVLGFVAYQQNDPGRALSLIGKAHELDPDCRDYVDALAVINGRLGKVADGLYFAKLAVALDTHPRLHERIPPDFRNYKGALDATSPSPNHVNALSQFEHRNFAMAASFCERELRINESNIPCALLMGRAYMETGEIDKAIAAFNRVGGLSPQDQHVYMHMADCMVRAGRFDDGLEYFRQAVRLAPADLAINSRAQALLAGAEGQGKNDFVVECQARVKEILSIAEPVELYPRQGGKLKIGYISDRFYDCAESRFFSVLFKSHDQNRIDLYGYQQNIVSDMVTSQLKSQAVEWRDVFDVDDETAALIMAGDGLDVLVDLCSYRDGQRLSLLALRPARVIAGWLSWPNGAGLGLFDVILSDPVLNKADKATAENENVLPMKAGIAPFSAETANLDSEKVSASPMAENGFVTFGGVCSLSRINPDVASAWARVLEGVPKSRLFLGYVKAVSEEVKEAVLKLFEASGVAGQVSFQETPEGETENTAFFSNVDVMLDAFPVTGGLEIYEALLAGIPVVTLAGSERSALMGASALTVAGKKSWIVKTPDAFVKKAISVAGDDLAKIRKTMPKKTASSTLCDCDGFAKGLEDIYEKLVSALKTEEAGE